MFANWLCKRYGLIQKYILINYLTVKVNSLELDKHGYKLQYDNKQLTEWSYYKQLWQIRGKLEILENIIDMLGKE